MSSKAEKAFELDTKDVVRLYKGGWGGGALGVKNLIDKKRWVGTVQQFGTAIYLRVKLQLQCPLDALK